MKVLKDPLGGWCVANHIYGSTWTIIEGRFKTMKNAETWLRRYKEKRA